MMFFIIGGDSQQYGPSGVDELREWVRQGRADRNTPARRDGEAEWKTLGEFPEFAEALGAQAAEVKPPKIQSLQEIFSREPDFHIGDCFARASTLLGANFGTLAGAALIVGVLDAVAGVIPFLGLLLEGVLYGGLALVFLRRVRGMEAAPSMVFAGFGRSFMQLALAGLVVNLLTSLSSCLFMVPFIYLKVAWALTLPLIVDKGLEFWSAMEVCRRVTTRVWFKMFALMLVAFSPFILASCYVSYETSGMWEARVMPLIPQDLSAILQDLPGVINKVYPVVVEVAKATVKDRLLAQIVWLVNLPFGTAVMIYAYEALFNPGKTPRP